jgi:hypothetical protein
MCAYNQEKPNGTINGYKDRQVVKGFKQQQQHLYYEDTFSHFYKSLYCSAFLHGAQSVCPHFHCQEIN